MVFEIRTAEPGDAAGIAAVWAAAMPQLVKTARGIEAELRNNQGRIVLIAVAGSEVVGYANLHLPDPADQAPRVRIAVQVPPAVRRNGIGTALVARVVDRAAAAGAARLLTVANDDSLDFATKHGFTIGRRMSHSQADLSTAPDPLPVPDGLRLVTYDALSPERLHEAEVAVRDDDPSGLSSGGGYDEWLARAWNHPDLRRDLSFAVVDGEDVQSFVSTTVDPDRRVIWSNLTGTVPSARGRGLAKIVKSHALAASRDAGMVTALTGNDAANVPMLAVNRWLGYRESGSAWTAEKDL
ncbi:GNAT family N-acetyltransferase [Kribbella sp. NBC_01505]|uniref:GNAT family N-acetyltransferase n=1 Tax=Kribbella sp. NBC_01505 TaxID=2903580 RepID=UPI00386D4405